MVKLQKEQYGLSVVFGSHFNSYSILQELHAEKIGKIALLYVHSGLASFSNIPTHKIRVKGDFESYYHALQKLSLQYGKLILFPTDDFHVEFFYGYYNKLVNFCYIPLNPNTYQYSIDKFMQYRTCEELGIPYPKSIVIESVRELGALSQISFPMIIKPLQREDLKSNTFRNIVLDSEGEFESYSAEIIRVLQNKVKLVVSEIIPGDTNGSIYAYCGFRSPLNEHKILNEWTGRKLAQHPNDYGVFSSASNEAPDEIRQHGERLIRKLNLYGFVEPEFKYDERDGLYKLMEINLRPMMWNRIGYLSGVKLHYTAWLDAQGLNVESYEQNKSRIIHFYYLRHELNNLRKRADYWPIFKRNLFKGQRNVMAIFNIKDLGPFFFDLMVLLKNFLKK